MNEYTGITLTVKYPGEEEPQINSTQSLCWDHTWVDMYDMFTDVLNEHGFSINKEIVMKKIYEASRSYGVALKDEDKD